MKDQKTFDSDVQTQTKHASEQLLTDKGKIKSFWEEKVRNDVQYAQNQTSIALLSSVDLFLDELVMALDHSKTAFSNGIHKQGMSKFYGEQRARFTGYFLPQLLKEFSILREVILEDLYQAKVLTFQVGAILNKTIDSAISAAATEFASVQQNVVQTALERAEISNVDLEHFAAVAAHDLKSPLATISSYLDLLMDDAGEVLSPDARKYITIMQGASERMRSLVDRSLDYARLAKMDKSFQSIDLNQVMTSVMQNLSDLIHKNRAEITYKNLPAVWGDMDLLAQVFQNLIANSVKFHGEHHPVIQIESVAQNKMFLFSFKDNGIGFDPKDKEDIFTLYKKLQGAQEHQGVGIGLATCKKVVEFHGGRIWADSEPGIGSSFYFTLPSSGPRQ
jgi:signal transduction histidine kinase